MFTNANNRPVIRASLVCVLAYGMLLGVLAGCATTEKPIEAMTSATPPLKVAVFADEGPGGIGAVEWARLVKTSPEMTLTLVDGKDVAAGKLAGQDVLVMPGGASKKEFKSLGPQGVARMKDMATREEKEICII